MFPERQDAGSATVWLVGLAALVGLSVTVGIVQGSAVLARHRAEAAADMAVLAGAIQASAGQPDPCGAAARIAGRNGVLLAQCAVYGEDVEVVVTRPLRLGTLGSWTASSRARAGPADRALAGRVIR